MAEPSIYEQILDPANRPNPYPLYAELRNTPVTREADGTYVVSTYNEIVALLHDPRVSFDPRSRSDIEVGGTTIPAAAPIVLALAAGKRDPHRFPDADRFDPDRTDNQHLGFGSSIHYCFGAPLARVEAQVALPALVHRLETRD